MVNAAILAKGNLALHIVQAVWSVVVMGVVIASLSANGPASGAAKYMFAMVSFPLLYVYPATHLRSCRLDEN